MLHNASRLLLENVSLQQSVVTAVLRARGPFSPGSCLALLVLQSRFGGKVLTISLVCPHKGTVVVLLILGSGNEDSAVFTIMNVLLQYE